MESVHAMSCEPEVPNSRSKWEVGREGVALAVKQANRMREAHESQAGVATGPHHIIAL